MPHLQVSSDLGDEFTFSVEQYPRTNELMVIAYRKLRTRVRAVFYGRYKLAELKQIVESIRTEGICFQARRRDSRISGEHASKFADWLIAL